MGLLNTLKSAVHNNINNKDKRSNYVFYKIVDFEPSQEAYLLQCINTKAVIYATIEEIVFDTDLLYGLHSTQACYIGLEYAKILKKNLPMTRPKKQNKQLFNTSVINRYGQYELCCQNRKGDLLIVNCTTFQETLMDPRDIALSSELIEQFDATQTFYIGVLAGLKLNTPPGSHNKKTTPKARNASHLKLVE